MNLALGVLVIFIISIPGIVFRLTFLSSAYSKRTINTTAIDEIFLSLIPAIFFHSIFILIIDSTDRVIDFQFIYNLLIGNNTAKDINALNDYLPGFAGYILAITLVNFLFGWLLRICVLKFEWYKSVQLLTIYNKWYPLLKPKPDEKGEISVWVDVLVETKSEAILYRGFIADFWLDKDGNICEIHLEMVRRRIFNNDENQANKPIAGEPENAQDDVDERYYYVPGELFIIKYSDVKNMNITYFSESVSPVNGEL